MDWDRDPEACYRALLARDERFDGRMFIGVVSTGIFCRPICPAGPPRAENCRFFPSAAAASEAGFRPCLRCRPEVAPETGCWRGTSNTVSRGLALIAAGELDGDSASVDALAERLGVGGRQLRRLFQKHLGASPITVAQTRRVLFAKQLLHDTCLPMTEVALAAGFGSLRRFNEAFQNLYRRPPSALRRKHIEPLPEGTVAERGVMVRLRYRPPFDWSRLLVHLRGRALDGVEEIEGDVYRRTIVEDGAVGIVEIEHAVKSRSLVATIRFPKVRSLPSIVTRIRRMFDLAADVTAIESHLAADPWLAPLVAKRPGLRVPGAWDSFELAVRAILGQQVSVEAGRRLTSQLTRVCGIPMAREAQPYSALTVAFPTPAHVAAADLSTLPMPTARRQAVLALAQAALDDPHLFQPLDTIEGTVTRLCSIRGVGPWTAHYIALRAIREPDAFPSGDAGLLRATARPDGARLSAKELDERAARWSPWRSYAAQHLWTEDAEESSVNEEKQDAGCDAALSR